MKRFTQKYELAILTVLTIAVITTIYLVLRG